MYGRNGTDGIHGRDRTLGYDRNNRTDGRYWNTGVYRVHREYWTNGRHGTDGCDRSNRTNRVDRTHWTRCNRIFGADWTDCRYRADGSYRNIRIHRSYWM